MTFRIKYHCGEALVGDVETAETLERARDLIDQKAADLDFKADLAVILRVTESGAEELEESRKLKPEIPLVGIGGQPIRDEIEFEYVL